jgi:hypothetical protein
MFGVIRDRIGVAWSTPGATYARRSSRDKSLITNRPRRDVVGACSCCPRYAGGSPVERVLNHEYSAERTSSPGPHAGVGVSDERREHHPRDDEDGYAQQNPIDDVAHVIDDEGTLGTQDCRRLG